MVQFTDGSRRGARRERRHGGHSPLCAISGSRPLDLLLDDQDIPADVLDRALAAQAAAYAGQPGLSLDLEGLGAEFEAAGLQVAKAELLQEALPLGMGTTLGDRWFGAGAVFAGWLSRSLAEDEIALLRARMAIRTAGAIPPPWRVATAGLVAQGSVAAASY